ncbi:hypothetical protein LCGC14_1725310 [marine sediment metagenome]|uniref:Uncharacterized protein n=1 Tax=marine sediment metagenome TaxID=412755 RepID=A0A0F9KAZ8_9ZZZZ
MSLLTDEEIIRAKEINTRIAASAEPWDKEIAKAQRAKDLKAVAEWEDGDCAHWGGYSANPLPRRACAQCHNELIVATRNGKMPGEE